MLLQWAVVFAVVGLIALLLGARGIAHLTFGIARLLFAIFLIIAVLLLVVHLLG